MLLSLLPSDWLRRVELSKISEECMAQHDFDCSTCFTIREVRRQWTHPEGDSEQSINPSTENSLIFLLLATWTFPWTFACGPRHGRSRSQESSLDSSTEASVLESVIIFKSHLVRLERLHHILPGHSWICKLSKSPQNETWIRKVLCNHRCAQLDKSRSCYDSFSFPDSFCLLCVSASHSRTILSITLHPGLRVIYFCLSIVLFILT